jgi:predicted outer membrane repeat protein
MREPPAYRRRLGASQGGAIYNKGTATITNSTFSDNQDDGYGGAIANANAGTITITGSGLTGNQAGLSGGALYNQRLGKVTISNTTFSSNQGADLGGGAIANDGSMTIALSNISNNKDVCCCDACGDAGGILNNEDASLTITTTSIADNFGGAGVGGIDNGGTLTVTRSLISGNYSEPNADGAGYGGGISSGPDLLIINSTITGNSANPSQGTGGCSEGGGLEVAGGIIVNSTIAYNYTFSNDGYNLADDDTCSFTATGSQNNATVMLAAGLANNGGPTQTIALEPDSPAIDVIPVADCTTTTGVTLTVDQRGFLWPGTGEKMCSIGAYEYQD